MKNNKSTEVIINTTIAGAKFGFFWNIFKTVESLYKSANQNSTQIPLYKFRPFNAGFKGGIVGAFFGKGLSYLQEKADEVRQKRRP